MRRVMSTSNSRLPNTAAPRWRVAVLAADREGPATVKRAVTGRGHVVVEAPPRVDSLSPVSAAAPDVLILALHHGGRPAPRSPAVHVGGTPRRPVLSRHEPAATQGSGASGSALPPRPAPARSARAHARSRGRPLRRRRPPLAAPRRAQARRAREGPTDADARPHRGRSLSLAAHALDAGAIAAGRRRPGDSRRRRRNCSRRVSRNSARPCASASGRGRVPAWLSIPFAADFRLVRQYTCGAARRLDARAPRPAAPGRSSAGVVASIAKRHVAQSGTHTGRSSILPKPAIGCVDVISIASSIQAQLRRTKPAIYSFVSAKGPAVTRT